MELHIKLQTIIWILLVSVTCSANKDGSTSVVVDSYVGSNDTFPQDFMFGCATAAFQVEGAWNVGGKGENIWDNLIHTEPTLIKDGCNADVASDSYHFYEKDVAALKSMGMNFYRFSISWARVLPTGDISSANEEGIAYYTTLVNLLIAEGIEPMITLYHWDLPQALQNLGGFANPLIVDYFEQYAKLMFTRLGSKVKYWITFNEPTEQCLAGYVDKNGAPRIDSHGVGEYICIHNVLLSHARAYRLYKNVFRDKYKGKVGITLVANWFKPKTESEADVAAAERAMQFQLGWLAHPIFTMNGGYPPVMVDVVDANSKAEGRAWSRLPFMDDTTKEYILGTCDFLGFNHYTSRLVSSGASTPVPSWHSDQGVVMTVDPRWPGSASSWLKVVPEGFRNSLKWVKDEYNNPLVFITENGFSDHGELQDFGRVDYICKYLNELLKAINVDGCYVAGYAAWSLVDNFEWMAGYTERFGLYGIDFDDPLRQRKPKLSSTVMRDIITTRKIPQL